MFPRPQGLRGCARILRSNRTNAVHINGARNYSVASLPTSRLNKRRPQSRIRDLQYTVQQSRSISWTGWWAGNPSEPARTPPPADGAPSIVDTEALKAIKASHATADTPDSSNFSSTEQFKPEILENVEDKFLAPKDGLAEVDPAQIVEYVGFMKQDCGLDFGWGPSALLQWIFEHMHITAGLPWATTILVTALLTRAVLIKPLLNQQRMLARFREVAPVMNPLREQYKDAVARGNRQEYMGLASQIRAIQKETGFSTPKMLLPMVLQVPLAFGGFRVLRNACELPIPSMENESFLWISSLAGNDPVVIPVLVGALTWRAMRRMAAIQPDGTQASMMNGLGIVLPFISIIFCFYQHTAVQLWFLATSTLALVQAELLGSQSFRNRFGLGAVPKKAPPQPPTDAFGYRMQKEVGGMRMHMYNDGRVVDITARDATAPSQNKPTGVLSKLKAIVDVEGFTKKTQVAAQRRQDMHRQKDDDKFELKSRQERDREIRMENERRKAQAGWVDESAVKSTGIGNKMKQ